MITICFTYFKSLTLANLAAALYSLRQQELTMVQSLIVVDNDTADSAADIRDVVQSFEFPFRVSLWSDKHGDPNKTHAWSTNRAVKLATSPLIFFTRADYLLDPATVQEFFALSEENKFVTSEGRHLHVPIETCEATSWRSSFASLNALHGTAFDYTLIDTGVWMARREAFEAVGGLNEKLTAWGHAQTDFQHRLWQSGVEFVKVPRVMFQHPHHGGLKDIDLAHKQLVEQGADLKAMWNRYEGVNPYASL